MQVFHKSNWSINFLVGFGSCWLWSISISMIIKTYLSILNFGLACWLVLLISYDFSQNISFVSFLIYQYWSWTSKGVLRASSYRHFCFQSYMTQPNTLSANRLNSSVSIKVLQEKFIFLMFLFWKWLIFNYLIYIR